MTHRYPVTPKHPIAEHLSSLDGTQAIYRFKNGYGASVVQHSFSYGGTEGFWELAILKGDAICYETPISSDVIGWLSERDVSGVLDRIEVL